MVGALLLYMAFLMLVDPLIRKPDAYTERLHNEEESEVRALPAPCPPQPPGPVHSSPLSVLPSAVFPQGGLPFALPGAAGPP